MNKIVIYHHGKDSIPWGEKTHAMAEVAKRCGYQFESIDYTASNDPQVRVKQCLAMDFSGYDELIFVGSSMGGYVSAVCAEMFNPRAIFLIAPAFYLPGYDRTTFSPPLNTLVMHGWNDTVVPPENAWRFSQTYQTVLKMFDSDHRLLSVLPQMADEFERLLIQINQ
ncbi:MAG: alpha/beta hydrolase [Gammaproteobacteria bacterium]|nr:alpha/beta hydrolase [Gammaproteobacteria bacterium]